MAELWIYDVIGEGFYEEGTTAKGIRDELKSFAKDEEINLFINSPGGDVFEAVAIKTQLEQSPNKINVQIDGVAASAASVIMLAGDTISMAEGSMVMIHEPWGLTVGDEAEHTAQANALGKVAVGLAEMYAKRAGKEPKTLREMMRAETWLTADEAIELGLADKSIESAAKAYKIPSEFGYKNAPKPEDIPETKLASMSVAAMRRKIDLTRRAARL